MIFDSSQMTSIDVKRRLFDVKFAERNQYFNIKI